MSYYVYRYVHPDYPWLYVGLSTNLPLRIYTHNNSTGDNIDRKWEKELRESRVYYHECSDEQDMKTTEKYLINTFKPVANIIDKSDKPSSLPAVDIGWKLYVQDNDSMANDSDNTRKSTKGMKQIHGPVMISWREEIRRAISEYLFPYFKKALKNKDNMMEFDLSDVPIECNWIVMRNLIDGFNFSGKNINSIRTEEQIEIDPSHQYIKVQISDECFDLKDELRPFFPTGTKRSKYSAVYLGTSRKTNKWEYDSRERNALYETFKVIDNVKIAQWDGGDILMRHFIPFWDLLSWGQKIKEMNKLFGFSTIEQGKE